MSMVSGSSVATTVALAATTALLLINPLVRKVSATFLEAFTNAVAQPEIPLAITALAATSRSINLCSSTDTSKELLKILAASGLIKCFFSYDNNEGFQKGRLTTVAGIYGLLGLTFIDMYS